MNIGLSLVLPLLIALLMSASTADAQPVRLGAKNDTETVVLGEILAILARDVGTPVRTQVVTAGSGLVFTALEDREIDAYVDYTGTLLRSTLSQLNLESMQDLHAALRERDLAMMQPLGFNNTYALAVTRDTAQRLGLRTTSDLRNHAALRVAVSNEWFGRADGWPALKQAYGLPQSRVTPLEHELLYTAVVGGQADVIEVYTTDAKISTNDLVILEDDRRFFPKYDAVVLYHLELGDRAPRVLEAWRQLEGALDEETMITLNARVVEDRIPPAQVAADFVHERFAVASVARIDGSASRLWRTTLQHLLLVSVSMVLGICAAVPLGVWAARSTMAGRVILSAVGVVQTIPSLALLVLMIPLLGLGPVPAIAALFLYSLLPMVRNTHAGLTALPRPVRESAEALGLTPWQRLTRVELPIALPAIVAGVITSAVITVGFATLGAFIGAGGYGEPILTGLNRNDRSLILQGAVPAAVLALLVQYGLGALSRLIISPGLRA